MWSVRRAIPYESTWLGLIVWGIVIGSAVSWTSWHLYQDHLFADHAKAVTGTVLQKAIKVTHGRHTSRTAYIQYRYHAGSVGVTCERPIKFDSWSVMEQGGAVPVLYLPEEPGKNRINLPAENEYVQRITLLSVWATLGFVVLGTAGTWYRVRRNRINRYLLTRGTSCQGCVTDVTYDVVGKQQTMNFYLLFSFRDGQGTEITGRTWYLQPGEEERWREGSAIPVFFNPGDSNQFTVDLRAPGWIS